MSRLEELKEKLARVKQRRDATLKAYTACKDKIHSADLSKGRPEALIKRAVVLQKRYAKLYHQAEQLSDQVWDEYMKEFDK